MDRLNRRASALIAVLLVTTAMLVLGLGLLTQKSRQYQSAARQRQAAQARAVAQAGLVDFEIKKRKDHSFPPRRAEGANHFSYSESFAGGTYQIEVDSSVSNSPQSLLLVTSQGQVGEARFVIYGEFDISPTSRSDPNQPNPRFHNWVHLAEQERPY